MRPRQASDGLCDPLLGSPEAAGQRPPPSPVSPTFTAHQLDGNLKRAAEEATLKKIYSLPLTGLWCDECQAPAHGLPAAMVEAVRQEEHLIKSLHAIVTKLKLGRIAWNKLWCFDCNTPAHGLPTHLKGELVARCEEFHAVSHTEAAAAPLPEKEALRRSKASSAPLVDLSTFSSLTCPADTPPAPPAADAPFTSLTPPVRPVLPPGGPPPEPAPSPAVHAQGEASPSFAVPPHALAQAPTSPPDFARSPMTKKKRPPSLLFVAANPPSPAAGSNAVAAPPTGFAETRARLPVKHVSHTNPALVFTDGVVRPAAGDTGGPRRPAPGSLLEAAGAGARPAAGERSGLSNATDWVEFREVRKTQGSPASTPVSRGGGSDKRAAGLRRNPPAHAAAAAGAALQKKASFNSPLRKRRVQKEERESSPTPNRVKQGVRLSL
eukprot:Rhum_TRINITY_DN6262_c0_g1::Rhum_TRINITY_DN6262_c0_g1_i1::g.19404::m.19404